MSKPELLEKLNLIHREDMRQLTGVTDETLDSWHRRGMGPPRIRLGNKDYYHLESAKGYLDLLAQDRIAKHCELSVADVRLEPLRKARKKGAAA